jgi:hypothetical protein
MRVDEEDIRSIKPRRRRTNTELIVIIAAGVFIGSIGSKILEQIVFEIYSKQQIESIRSILR